VRAPSRCCGPPQSGPTVGSTMRTCASALAAVARSSIPRFPTSSAVLAFSSSAHQTGNREDASTPPWSTRKCLNTIGPFVTENQVIVLMPPPEAASLQAPRDMTRVLNSSETTAVYDRICGTANVSVRTLLGMKLPVTNE
jgi:hypothetical protein